MPKQKISKEEKIIGSIDPSKDPPVTKIEKTIQGNGSEKDVKEAKLIDLIKKNIKWSQAIYEQNKKIKRRMFAMAISNYIKLFLIIAPIIVGIIYLPRIIREFIDEYGELFGDTMQITEMLSGSYPGVIDGLTEEQRAILMEDVNRGKNTPTSP